MFIQLYYSIFILKLEMGQIYLRIMCSCGIDNSKTNRKHYNVNTQVKDTLKLFFKKFQSGYKFIGKTHR